MKDALKQAALIATALIIILAGMAWLTCGREIKQAVNREAQARNWQPLFQEPEDHVIQCQFVIPKECMMAKTQIKTAGPLELFGELWMTSHNGAGNYDAWFCISWGMCGLSIRLESDDPNRRARFACILDWAGNTGGLTIPPDFEAATYYTDWFPHWLAQDYQEHTLTWKFLATTAGHRIHRTRHIEPWRGSTTGPTHAIETRFTDQWVTDDEERWVTIQTSIQLDKSFPVNFDWEGASYGTPMGVEVPVIINPDSPITTIHQLHWPTRTDFAYCRLTLDGFDFSALEDHCYGRYPPTAPKGTNPGDGNMGVWGDANTLTYRTFGEGTGFGSHPYHQKGFTRPRILDLREYGLVGWGQTSPQGGTP